jgi:hypothetical protein
VKRLLVVAFIAAVAIGAFTAWRFFPAGQTYLTDANTIREPADTAQVRDVLWEPPVLHPEPINAGGETYEPRLSNDGTTLYFVRGKAGGNADIFITKRTAQGWSDPQPMTEINSPADDLGPEMSTDGETLYFYSNRAGGQGGYDLWVSRRGTDGAWREPANLGPQVNSPFNDYGPALTADGRVLYFSSNRPLPGDDRQPDPGAWPATLREEFFTRTYDLYASVLSDSGPGDAKPLGALNTPHNEGAPALSSFGDFLYFASDRPGGSGGFDLYRSRRLRNELQSPTNLGGSVNTAFHELDPALSMNGFGLDFSSNRLAAGHAPNAAREYKLYHTNSREVFSETQRPDRPPIDWAALWRAVGPNLLWALLALALLALMLLLFKAGQNRRLSLLAKCVLASLAAHLLLMLLFNVWEVAASLAGEFQRGSVIKVALAGPASHSISAQLTGSLSEITTPDVELASLKAQPAVESVAPSEPLDSPPQRTKVEFTNAPLAAAKPDESPAPGPAPVVPEFVPSTTVPPETLALKMPVPAPATPVSEASTRAEPAPAPTTIARAENLHSTTPDSAPSETPERVPPRTQFAETPNNLRLAVDEVREAHVDRQPEPLAALSVQPAIALQKFALPSSLPDAPLTKPHAEIAASVSPASAVIATQRHKFDATTPVESPSDSVGQGSPPPSTRLDLQPAKVDKDFGVHVSDSVAAAPRFVEAIPVSSDLFKSNPAIKLALPDAAGSPIRADAEADAVPMPLKSDALARAALPSAPQPPPATTSKAVLDLARTQLPTNPNSTPSVLSIVPIDAFISQYNLSDDKLTPLALSAAPSAPAFELNLPTDLAPPENPYPQRTADDRLETVKRMGGSEQTEVAVALALEWLARHQSPDGHWDADGFDARCGDCGGETNIAADHALTGLGMLCFLGAGHTHTQPGQYQDNVQRALNWLVSKQKSDGDLRGGKETMYTQGIATIALAESYAMTADARLGDPVQRAASFIYRARNPQAGGWRYDPGQAGDTSVLGWQVMALKSAARAGVPVPENAFAHARAWLDRVSKKSDPGLYCYQPNETPSPSMTAESLFVQQLLGQMPNEPRMLQSVDFVLDHLPDWDKEAPTYFWYYASLALFQHQGDAWRTWNAAISKELIEHQRRDGRAAGSWDPSDDWSRLGGRVYQTALCTLMLEVYYRYLPMYGQDALVVQSASADAPAPDEIIGAIRGTVTDKVTTAPLAAALVRLVLSDRETLTATTDSKGKYTLDAPATPDFFALSASLDPYVPQTISVERARLESRKKLVVNFALEPHSDNALVTEAAPDVHHLGDDRFSGDINSQFQKKSEGAKFTIAFEIAPDSLATPLERAEVRLMAKGVQRRHKIFVNDKLLDRRLDKAPEDGSFGEFVAPFDPSWLTAGANTLRVDALPSDDDIDDFEFVNIRIYLVPPTGPNLGTGTSLNLDSGTTGTQ